MKLAWLTDIHLNFLDFDGRDEFYTTVVETRCDAVLITGDISDGRSISSQLKEMSDKINLPIYFVLGNHDYYHAEVSEIKSQITALTASENLLGWLPAVGPTVLKEGIVLLGQDGWADGRYGDYANSRVVLNDSRFIADLFQKRIIGKHHLLEKMQSLADQDALQLKSVLTQAIKKHSPRQVIVLTHVPPFKEACIE